MVMQRDCKVPLVLLELLERKAPLAQLEMLERKVTLVPLELLERKVLLALLVHRMAGRMMALWCD